MRYIKIPKIMSAHAWSIGTNRKMPLTLAAKDWGGEDKLNYIKEFGEEEYILDARIFRSKVVVALLS